MIKLLFITAELFPLVKTGGLADYSQAIPLALHKEKGVDVRIMLPSYPAVMRAMRHTKVVVQVESLLRPAQKISVVEGRVKGFPFPLLMVDSPILYDREGNPYLDSSGKDWADNFERFATLSMMPYLLASHSSSWIPDIVHANDWHTGLAPAYLQLMTKSRRPATVFTIHNIAFQGNFPKEKFSSSGLPKSIFNVNGVEFFDQLSFLKAGINFADKVVTVSPQYAKEIAHREEFGLGFCGILRQKNKDFSGILNGVDYKLWSPKKDSFLKMNYALQTLENKKKQKAYFQKSIELPPLPNAFLLSSVSRLSYQKGLDVVCEILEEILPSYPFLQFVCVGMGDGNQERDFDALSRKYPKQVKFIAAYDEGMAHQVIGSSDAFVMPSRFEPCGLTQIYSLKYGTIPLVTPVGGLLDTVEPYSIQEKKVIGDGFVAKSLSKPAIREMIVDAFSVFTDKQKDWTILMQNAMKKNFSWTMSVKHYNKLYDELLS